LRFDRGAINDYHHAEREGYTYSSKLGDNMLHAVIMAGGSGTRFWPASRRLVPKQLLALSSDRTMIQSTVDRLGSLVPPERQLVLTNRILTDAVRMQLPDIPADNVIGEPCKRDTAPCIGLAAAIVQHRDPEGTMLVMPSDHVIASPEQFQSAISAGQKLVDDDPTRIVTFGIRPTYPAQSFGYVQRSESINANGVTAYQVDKFREKPDLATAEEYLAAGTFFWNSGIFLWRAATILEALQSNVPEMHGHIAAIAAAIGSDSYPATLEQEFSAIIGQSIDYAVMESYPNVIMIEAPFTWDDVGSWQALARLHEPDAAGNTVIGSHIGIDTKGAIIRSQGEHTIVTIDVEDLIVVHTDDATLVAPKHAEERVREVVKALEQQNRDDLL
jgi:mannose-1-phosphate guanylyltransferase